MKVQETIFAQSFVSRVYGMPVLSFLTPDFLLGAAIPFKPTCHMFSFCVEKLASSACFRGDKLIAKSLQRNCTSQSALPLSTRQHYIAPTLYIFPQVQLELAPKLYILPQVQLELGRTHLNRTVLELLSGTTNSPFWPPEQLVWGPWLALSKGRFMSDVSFTSLQCCGKNSWISGTPTKQFSRLKRPQDRNGHQPLI